MEEYLNYQRNVLTESCTKFRHNMQPALAPKWVSTSAKEKHSLMF